MERSTTPALLALAVLTGCGGHLDPQSGVVLDAFGFGWNGFNHRLSHLQVEPDEDAARVAIVGGTSTTSERTDVAGTCDPEACKEYPVPDSSAVELSWSVLQSDTVALVPFSVDLEAGAAGAEQTVTLTLPKGAKGQATALLSGLYWSSDHALSGGEACYVPRLGWHPRRLMLAIGEPTVDGESATVTVSAAFEAGNTFDPERACIDEVNEQAVAAMRIDGLLLVGKDLEVEEHVTDDARSYPFSGDKFNPEEQVPAEPIAVSLGVDAVVAGTSSMDWRFYPEATDGKGAYLRTIGFLADPTGSVGAWATNYSPGTQLEDFAYEVTLTSRFVAADVQPETLSATAELPTQLEMDGSPIVHLIEP
ncbi:MAG: hypothetical protein H6735_25610 [Alphaproteobacteria bacterium]|nr:hypothetical protein [Alphaproteobacteria bacterium]